jgi:hypothetical protein
VYPWTVWSVGKYYGLSQNVKKEIDKLFELNLKPKSIMNSLSKIEGIRLPKMTQLKKYLSDRRRAKYGNQTKSLGELEASLLSHSMCRMIRINRL